MLRILIVGTGGFCGAVLRYGLSGWVQRRWPSPFPWGTLSVNVLGCLALGVMMALVEGHEGPGERGRFFLAVGLLGSFTTFSTFGYETVELARAGAVRDALLYVVGNLLLGVLALLAGRFLVWFFGG